jgi:heme exporter protein D
LLRGIKAQRVNSEGFMWDSWSDFVAMGGYGLYVWGSYLVTFALIALELAAVRHRGRAAVDNASRLRASEGGAR